MKTNQNSLLNKFADIHAELVKLNKRVCNIESVQEKNIEELKNEVIQRQNTEKKTYQQSELLNGKIFSIRKGLEDLTSNFSNQLESFKEKADDNLKTNYDNLFKSINDKVNRIEIIEKKTKDLDKEIEINNTDNNKKLMKGIETLNENFRDLRNELEKQASTVEVVEKRLGDFYNSLTEDIRELVKQVAQLKQDQEVLKSYKESCQLNFRDISNQFIDKYIF